MDTPPTSLDPVVLALLLMFGSALVGAAVGALVGRFARFEAGLAAGMLIFGAGAMAGAARVAWHHQVETAVVELPRSGCAEQPGAGTGQPQHTLRYGLVLPDGREATLVTPPTAGPCPPSSGSPPQRLRYRLAELGTGTTLAAVAEPDPVAARALPWVFVAFGSFGLLAGLFFVALVRAERRRERLGPDADRAPVVSAGRRAAARWFNLTANLLVLVTAVSAAFAGDDGIVSAFRLFASIAVACVCYAIAFALRGLLRMETLLALVIIGAGFGGAAWSLLLLG